MPMECQGGQAGFEGGMDRQDRGVVIVLVNVMWSAVRMGEATFFTLICCAFILR